MTIDRTFPILELSWVYLPPPVYNSTETGNLANLTNQKNLVSTKATYARITSVVLVILGAGAIVSMFLFPPITIIGLAVAGVMGIAAMITFIASCRFQAWISQQHRVVASSTQNGDLAPPLASSITPTSDDGLRAGVTSRETFLESSKVKQGEPFHIFVKMLDGKFKNPLVYPSTTIGEIKAELIKEYNDPDYFRRSSVWFAGYARNDECTVAEANIQKESTLHVCLRHSLDSPPSS